MDCEYLRKLKSRLISLSFHLLFTLFVGHLQILHCDCLIPDDISSIVIFKISQTYLFGKTFLTNHTVTRFVGSLIPSITISRLKLYFPYFYLQVDLVFTGPL